MAQPVKHYFIGRSDEGYTCMSEERLEELLDMMPTLRFLLLGHPNMKPKALNETEDGTQILEIPSTLPVTLKSFILLVNCAFKVTPLPQRHRGRLEELEETIVILGGCKELECRLHNYGGINPMTPEEDTKDEFEWTILTEKSYLGISNHQSETMTDKGFSFTTNVKQEGEDRVYHFYFRKRRG